MNPVTILLVAGVVGALFFTPEPIKYKTTYVLECEIDGICIMMEDNFNPNNQNNKYKDIYEKAKKNQPKADVIEKGINYRMKNKAEMVNMPTEIWWEEIDGLVPLTDFYARSNSDDLVEIKDGGKTLYVIQDDYYNDTPRIVIPDVIPERPGSEHNGAGSELPAGLLDI
jgi:hypothetical protein